MAPVSLNPGGLLRRARAWWERPEPPMEPRPLTEHLSALRRTLILCILAVSGAFLVVFLCFSKQLVNFVTEPLTAQNIQVIFTGVSEAFTAQTKLSFIVGAVLASPVAAAAVWLFVRPALHRKERVWTAVLTVFALGLFILGVWFAYRFVFFLAVNFFVYAGDGVARPLLSLGTYVNFLFGFLLPFGAMFELPILVIGLTRLGIVTTQNLNHARKYVIFGIFILAAILTPPDVVSQVLLGIPMWGLFEVGVLFSWLFRPRERAASGVRQAV